MRTTDSPNESPGFTAVYADGADADFNPRNPRNPRLKTILKRLNKTVTTDSPDFTDGTLSSVLSVVKPVRLAARYNTSRSDFARRVGRACSFSSSRSASG